jgi:hypothetical protein
MRPFLAILPTLVACPSEEAPVTRYTLGELGGAVGRICPGDPSGACDWSTDTDLVVGAAKVAITPQRWEEWTDVDGDSEFHQAIDTYRDCGGDRLCPGDAGYTAPDAGEGDGYFQGLWLAGFQNARAMNGVADDLWARATVLRQGETTLAVVALDVVGFFYNEVQEIRDRALALGIDHVVVVSSHVHEAPDTMGLWGPQVARSGVNPEFMDLIHTSIDLALQDALASAVPADLYLGHARFEDADWGGRGINNVNIDHRDPNIVDRDIWTARFAERGGGDTIATWVNWPNHPEAASDENLMVTSDFAHTLRTTVEEGATTGPLGPRAGTGGVALYLQGACGGMMTPLGAHTLDLDGTDYSSSGLDKAAATGRVVGYVALGGVEEEVPSVTPLLSFRTRVVRTLVENRGYWVMINAGIFDRPAFDYDTSELVGEGNEPTLETEVSLLQLGELSAVTVPGELLPEILIGGYDGSGVGPLQTLVDADNPNPPDMAQAPAGPYLRDLIPGEFPMLWGLANDELGYIVPAFAFELHPSSPYLDEAEGDHYEETKSVGPQMEAEIIGAMRDLLAWTPPPVGDGS